MECKVCGAIVRDGSIYCQKCGKKINEIGITLKNISSFLSEKVETFGTAEMQQYWKTFIEGDRNKFKSLEIHKNSLEGINLSKLFYEEGDRLHINCQNPEDFLELAAVFFINEMASTQTALNNLKKDLHGSKIAKMKAAYDMYEMAILTKSNVSRKKQLDDALSTCILGIRELKEEMENHLELFAKLPRSTIGKLFCGIKLQEAETALVQMQEAFSWYCNAVRLWMCIEIQNEELDKLEVVFENERDFLKEMINSKGYQRLLEVDEDNAGVWEQYVNCLEVGMYCVEKFIKTDTITIKILEEKNE